MSGSEPITKKHNKQDRETNQSMTTFISIYNLVITDI